MYTMNNTSKPHQATDSEAKPDHLHDGNHITDNSINPEK